MRTSPKLPTSRGGRVLLAALLAATVAVSAGCTSSGNHKSSSKSSSAGSSSHAAAGHSGSSGGSSGGGAAAPPAKSPSGVSLQAVQLKITGKDGTLSGTIKNTAKVSYTLTSISCACATTIMVGKPGSGGKVVPQPGGVTILPGKTLTFGNGELVVALHGLLPVVKKGAHVPVTASFAGKGAVLGSASVIV